MLAQVVVPLSERCHWYASGAVPLAATAKVTGLPWGTVCESGWSVIAGGCAGAFLIHSTDAPATWAGLPNIRLPLALCAMDSVLVLPSLGSNHSTWYWPAGKLLTV